LSRDGPGFAIDAPTLGETGAGVSNDHVDSNPGSAGEAAAVEILTARMLVNLVASANCVRAGVADARTERL
jgi:hypothetical protein